MRKTLSVLGLTLLMLALLDLAVAGLLGWAEENGRLGRLVRYFEYGRSVPGKLARWEADPDVPGNLYDVAWRPDGLAISADGFARETSAAGPVLRSYGMSFSNNILRAAQAIEPGLVLDFQAGPGAPPNFTYAMFLDDRPYRRAGDVVVLAFLASSVPAMAALSNRTWVFEQPAPFTYPVFRPDTDGGLERIEPVVTNAGMQRRLGETPELAAAWDLQLRTEDAFHSPVTFGATWLDRSPFFRLVRRSLATAHVAEVKGDILHGGYPYPEVLRRMVADFARIARADRQIPVVLLIQTSNPVEADLRRILDPVLRRERVPHLDTAEHFDPRNIAGFRPDGHYIAEVDRHFGAQFLKVLRSAGFRP